MRTSKQYLYYASKIMFEFVQRQDVFILFLILVLFAVLYYTVEIWAKVLIPKANYLFSIQTEKFLTLKGLFNSFISSHTVFSNHISILHNWFKASQRILFTVRIFSIQGRRSKMEDYYIAECNIEDSEFHTFAVIDGHGGKFAADFIHRHLLQYIKNYIYNLNEFHEDKDIKENNLYCKADHSSVLKNIILDIDNALLSVCRKTGDISGSTLLIALIHAGKLIIVNIGDSRGILYDACGKIIPLSFDHKPEQKKERKRIEDAGGFISFNGVWRVAGVLATSRALGDFPLKDKNFLTAEPDIYIFELEEIQPQFLILATDGLWDVITNKEAAQFISKNLQSADFGISDLVKIAYNKGSMDNISAVVLRFKYSETNL